ncbi:hypothetical protein [Psychrobacter sp. BF1]|uniref:hypothetical protein n=1 Tax=Psychrobacter sp. BF1 TaxID=2821147 RepID=UPI001C4DDB36|nr:hypothetical protein [Psychrobacter sp. BF1]
MAKYRKKTITRALVEVYAVEWLATKQSWDEVMALGDVRWSPVNSFGASSFYIDQDDEKIEVNKGDYVIKDASGVFYTCEPDVFAKTHSLISD